MICDLLARAGISSRVDGEFLAGAGGELPLGSGIRVRVNPARAAEAREVINDWEKTRPPPDAAPAPASAPRKRSSWRSPLWFLAGAVVGGGLTMVVLRTPYTTEKADFDGDGVADEVYHYQGDVVGRVDFDRNADLEVDARWINDIYGLGKRHEADDDFNGTFEWRSDAEHGQIVSSQLDADGNGKPERVITFKHGVAHTIEIYDPNGERVVVREKYDHTRQLSAEYDKDGDGVFERRVEFDEWGEPLSPQAAP
jgi:hypothetical protein